MSKPSIEALRGQAMRLIWPTTPNPVYEDKDEVLQRKYVDPVVQALGEAYEAGRHEGFNSATYAGSNWPQPTEKVVRICDKPDHWHRAEIVSTALCVRGLIHGLQQYGEGFNHVINEIEKERP